MIFSWQTNQWQTLWQSYQQQRLPHALLLVGMSGIGKKQFAIAFAKTMLCRKPNIDGQPCGQCHPCHLTRANTHPDLVMVEPEEAGQLIKIDQIRHVIQLANETPQQGGYKVIIISPANAMNKASANALLKTLEEPAPNTLLILTTDQSVRLPATVMSRCQKILFQKPTRDVALQWLISQDISSPDLLLDLAEGAPLKAKEFLDNNIATLRNDFYQGLVALSKNQADPLQLAAQWYEEDTRLLLTLLLNWLRDLLRVKLVNADVELINTDYRAFFSTVKLSNKNLLKLIDKVQQTYARIINSLNLNKQLLLEELLIRWVQYGSS